MESSLPRAGVENELCQQLERLGIRDCALTVGVSGGADSVALLCGLRAVQQALGLTLVAGHVDHGLRQTSADDAEWVAVLCAELAVDVEVRRARVGEVAEQTGAGIEETARRVRYELLTEIATGRGCRYLAVAHTADDQAETILHHVLRGTGLSGLRGMPAVRELESGVRLVRPLLLLRRKVVHAYLREIGREYREDDSNTDPVFTRNRIRGTLLPLLREEFNPRVEEALLRLGVQAGEWQDVIGELADGLLKAMILDAQPDHVRLDCRKAVESPRPLVREALKRLWERQGWPRGGMTFEHWDQLASQAGEREAGAPAVAGPPPRMTLPGAMDVHRRGELLTISRRV